MCGARKHAAVILASLGMVGCDTTNFASESRVVDSEWPEADRLFRSDPFWVGGDGAYSIDLGNGRVLWMFGDSWINPRGKGTRRMATMVSNSLAIQHGYDPANASMEFFWGKRGLRTQAFFPDEQGLRYWPGNGILVDDRLILFLMDVGSSNEGMGFDVRGWSAVLVYNPDENPDSWDIQWLDCPGNDLRIIVGSGGILSVEGYVYAYSSMEGGSKHDIYLTRWLRENLRSGHIRAMEWWCGDQRGWQIDEAGGQAVPVFSNAQTEFTVHYDEKRKLFVETQHDGFGKAVIVQRTSPELTGPWSEMKKIFNPSENRFERIMIYQGKAHPELRGAKQIITYCTNSSDFSDHINVPWIYYPCFVRLE